MTTDTSIFVNGVANERKDVFIDIFILSMVFPLARICILLKENANLNLKTLINSLEKF